MNSYKCCLLVPSYSVVSDSLQPLDCNPPGSSVHRIFQARILKWVATFYCRGRRLSWRGAWTHVSCISDLGRWIFFLTTSATWEACAFSILFSLPSWSVFLEIHFLPDFQKYPGFDLFHCFLFHSFLLLLLLSLLPPTFLRFSLYSLFLFVSRFPDWTQLTSLFSIMFNRESHIVASIFLFSFNNTTLTLTE